jgi:hypothetical protein
MLSHHLREPRLSLNHQSSPSFAHSVISSTGLTFRLLILSWVPIPVAKPAAITLFKMNWRNRDTMPRINPLIYFIRSKKAKVGDFQVSLTYGALNQEADTSSDNNMFMKEKEDFHEKMIEDLSLLGALNNIPLSWNNASNTIKSHENVINSYHSNNNNNNSNKNTNSKQKQPI